jgi:hypothetical protein
MDDAADREYAELEAKGRAAKARESADRATAPPHAQTPSERRAHEEQLHDEAEQLAVEGDDLSEIFYSVLGKERPHVGEPPAGGASWTPPLGDAGKDWEETEHQDER